MRTRVPKNADEAWAEIDKGLDELNRAQARFKKAQRYLIHHGNTVSHSSAAYHYAVSLRETYSDFTNIRLKMSHALDTYRKEVPTS